MSDKKTEKNKMQYGMSSPYASPGMPRALALGCSRKIIVNSHQSA